MELGPKKEVAQISALQFRMNNLEEVTEENFCELATKDARMGNIVIGVYRCFIGASDCCFIDLNVGADVR